MQKFPSFLRAKKLLNNISFQADMNPNNDEIKFRSAKKFDKLPQFGRNIVV